mmetsp:Transcript_15691/g.40124  ORF Transcript_15691/g.40124 Transcript_15691/m.40124 type:complete len:87 (+) Transcript_15691:4598-4858(+)
MGCMRCMCVCVLFWVCVCVGRKKSDMAFVVETLWFRKTNNRRSDEKESGKEENSALRSPLTIVVRNGGSSFFDSVLFSLSEVDLVV